MSPKKILVIDDDELVRRSIQNLLVKVGYEIVSSHNADTAIEEIKRQKFDLIVSDIRMPGKNGVETVKEIRRIINQRHPMDDIPIIFITGYAESSDELKAELLGEVILKPFDLDHLLITIREYL